MAAVLLLSMRIPANVPGPEDEARSHMAETGA